MDKPKEWDWKYHGEKTLAAYRPDKDFRGLFEKRIAVAPDHLAILIRDGKIIEAVNGAHFSVGGVWQRIKELFGGKHSIELLVADLKPFPVIVDLGCVTKDSVEVPAEVAVEFQLNPERPVDIMGLVPDSRSLTFDDVYRRVRPHLQERILVAETSQHEAAQLRANTELQDRIQAHVMSEVERIAGDLGLLVRAVSVNWGLTADEKAAIERRNIERADEMAEFQHKRTLREFERQSEVTIFQIEAGQAQDLAVGLGDEQTAHAIAKLFTENKIEIKDVISTGERVEAMKQLEHDLETARQQLAAGHEAKLASATNDQDKRRIELDIKRLDMAFAGEQRRFELELGRLEREQERDLKQGDELSELAVADKSHDLHQRRMQDMANLNQQQVQATHDLAESKAKSTHDRQMEAKREDQMTELELLRLKSQMSRDQLLALEASKSDAAARALGEVARADAGDTDLMREMLDRERADKERAQQEASATREQALDRVADVGVAAGSSGTTEGGGARSSDSTECPKCHHQVPLARRFCGTCGEQLRT